MDNPAIAESESKHRSIDLTVPCRICAPCLRLRQRLWTGRARAEITMAERTWFLTLTFKPELQDRALNLARQDEAQNGRDYDALGSSEQFAGRLKSLSPEVTKFLKRVRKDREHGVRHLVVAEAHQSGAPHFHALLHHTKETLVTYRNIEDQWKALGFLAAKLVPENDPAAAYYVCKYLGKSADARVRASLHYGNVISALAHKKF